MSKKLLRPGLLVGMACLVGLLACRVKTTERLPPGQVLPLQTATREELRARLERQAEAVTTLNGVAELVPSTGSAYSGVIEEYHDVRAFLLAERRPAPGSGAPEARAPGVRNRRQVRLIGQAPLVRKTVFDMVADDTEFRVYLPSKNKFIVGQTGRERRREKPIENLRPQHLFEALFPAAPERGPLALLFLEENEFSGRRYYALTEITSLEDHPGPAYGVWHLSRKWWFDRADLSLVRVQRFDAEGRLVADVHYSQWREANGLAYPRTIELARPQEDYRLKLLLKELTLNQPIPAERFRLEKPAEAELVEVSGEPEAGGPQAAARERR